MNHPISKEKTRLSERSEELLRDFDLEEFASHLIRRTHFFAENLFKLEFSDEDITPRQKAALILIIKNPKITQNALCEALHLDRNTVSDLVNRIVKNGYATKTRSTSDKRSFNIEIASRGEEIIERVIDRDIGLNNLFLKNLSEKERFFLIKCLKKILITDASA